MSFTKQAIRLNGSSNRPVHQLKLCSKCNSQRVPEGGIELSPTRWVCAVCWSKRPTSRKP